MAFTFASLLLNFYTSVSGCDCGFGFEQKYWRIDGFGGKKARIGGYEPTTPNMSQHVATGWPNVRNMLLPAMLRYVAFKCCDRLAGA